MTVQHSDTLRNARLDAETTVLGAGWILKLRTGAQPANVATASSGTVLASYTPTAAAAAGGSKTMVSSPPITATAAAGGFVGHYELTTSGGTVHERGNVSQNWAASTAYVAGQRVNNGGKVYVCATGGTSAGSGGPSGTATGITDGTATWDYVAPGPDLVIDNTSIAVGQSVQITGFVKTEGHA